MPKRGKKYLESRKKVDAETRLDFNAAVTKAVDSAYANFDETIDVTVRLGVDPRHADQMVRGTVVLPNGLGKEVKVLVFAKGEKEKEALDAGTDFVGNDDLIEKIKGGWFGLYWSNHASQTSFQQGDLPEGDRHFYDYGTWDKDRCGLCQGLNQIVPNHRLRIFLSKTVGALGLCLIGVAGLQRQFCYYSLKIFDFK